MEVMKEELKTAHEWQALMPKVKIIDADGWRDGTSMDKPITKEEYLTRRLHCTCSFENDYFTKGKE